MLRMIESEQIPMNGSPKKTEYEEPRVDYRNEAITKGDVENALFNLARVVELSGRGMRINWDINETDTNGDPSEFIQDEIDRLSELLDKLSGDLQNEDE
jgi:hypothetical protein